MARKAQKGRLIDSAIVTNSESYRVEDLRKDLRVQHRDASIRTFRRDVKADGETFPVHIVTVRERIKKS